VKDKSPNSKEENETPTKTNDEEVKENGANGTKSETKETITPVVAKLAAAGDESSDQVDKTATLPASFKKKEVETGGKTETLPRNLSRSTSFTNSCRNWAKKKGLVKDKSPNSKEENETPTKTNDEEVKENGANGTKSETKETITPVVAKLAAKKARAQFFEEMYNSSGISVSSSLTPEKPKRLCDMNLPSPRIGPGSPSMDKPKVEQIVEMIEEKEKLNRSNDSEANSSLNRSMEAEVKREAVVSPAKEVVEVATKVVDEVPIKEQDDGSKTSTEAASPKEEISEEANIENWKDGKMEVNDDVLEAAKEETEDVIDTIEELQEALEEKKDIEEVQEILEEKDIGDKGDSDGLFVDTSNDASKAWQEAKEEMLEKVEESTMDQVEQVQVEESAMDETLPSNSPLLQPEATMQTFESQQEENEAKEEVVEEVGEVKDDLEDEQCSLEKEEEGVEEKDNGENVISGGGEEGETSDEEERDEEKESIEGEQQGGALGLRRELQSDDEEEEEKGGN